MAILISKDLLLKIYEETIYRDPSGNLIILNCNYETYVLTLCCLYGPNTDSPNFYEETLHHHIERLQADSEFTLIGGDWNITLNQELDTHGYTHENNPKAKEKVIEFMKDKDLHDIFREFHPERKRYSWRQFGGKNVLD